MKTNRREFAVLGGSTVLSAATPNALGELLQQPAAATAKAGGELPWYRRIRRVGQTNFNEKDPLNANVEAWADYWAGARVDAVALSVSGLIAFYPTEVPYFRRSRWLNGRDLFGECVKAAKARGLRVYARMSPDIQPIDDEILRVRPLTYRRNANGGLDVSAPGVARTCQFSTHYSEQQPAIIRELNARYEIDGLYMNGWPSVQRCYCENCKKIGDPNTQVYKDAVLKSATELVAMYKRLVTEKNPNNFYSCNLGGGLSQLGLDQWQLTREAQWYTADNQSREAVVSPVWADAQQVKFARCLMGERAVAAVTGSYGRAGNVLWRNATGEPYENECRMAQTSATGGIIWYHWLGLEQSSKDRRWQKLGNEFFRWHAKNDRHFHNVQSLTKVAILAAPNSNARYDAPSAGDKTDPIEGMTLALNELRVPFDFLHEQDMTAASMGRYALIVLPNVALLSDAQARALEQYAASGGSLLATFETGLYDENGKERAEFALGELFGISKTGPRQRTKDKTLSNASIHLQEIRERNALTAGFEDTEWIGGPVWRVPLKPVADAAMTFINPYATYPPEAVYAVEPPTDEPAIVTQDRGGSRLVYLAGDVDATYWRMDNWDLGQQLRNAIAWVLNGRNPVQVDGEGLMEVAAWETEPGFAVHFVNYNGPNAYRGHMRKPLALGPQVVKLTLPREVRIKRASLLKAERPLTFKQTGRVVEFTVPSVGVYEVAALEV